MLGLRSKVLKFKLHSKKILKYFAEEFVDEDFVYSQLAMKFTKLELEKVIDDGDVKKHYLSTFYDDINPNYLFETSYYLEKLSKLGIFLHETKENPLVHYLSNYRKLDFTPSSFFDLDYFKKRYYNSFSSNFKCAWADFFLNNKIKKYDPSPSFDSTLYLARYRDIYKSNFGALEHFLLFGKDEGRLLDLNKNYSDPLLVQLLSSRLLFENISPIVFNPKTFYIFENGEEGLSNLPDTEISSSQPNNTIVRLPQTFTRIIFHPQEFKPRALGTKLSPSDYNEFDPSTLFDKNWSSNSIPFKNILVNLTPNNLRDLSNREPYFLISLQKVILASALRCYHVKIKDLTILPLLENLHPRFKNILSDINLEISINSNPSLFRKFLCEARYIALEEHTGFLVPDIDCDNEVFQLSSPFPKISIVLCTKRPSFIPNVIENLSQQSYKNFEILILASRDFTEDDIRRFRAELQDKQIDHAILQQKFDFPLGSGLNLLAQRAKYELITKWDDDDFYGKNYLKNISLDFYNLDFGLAGKFPEFFHFEGMDEIISNLPHLDYFAQHPIFSGSTLTFTKKALYEVSSFPDISTGEDLLWRNNMHAKGALAYCLPSFDHIVNRFKSGHSWNFDKDKFLEEAENKYWLINESKRKISITRSEIDSNN